MRYHRLQRIEAVVEGKQRVTAIRDDHRFVLDRQAVDFGTVGPVGTSVTEVRFFHLAAVF